MTGKRTPRQAAAAPEVLGAMYRVTLYHPEGMITFERVRAVSGDEAASLALEGCEPGVTVRGVEPA